MSWLSQNLTGHNKNPADSANQYLNQIPDVLKQYFQPYMQQGQQAGQQLTGQYNQMTTNPGELYSQLGQGYKESPGYQFRLKQALQAGQNASAAGGMLGTPQDQQQQSGIAEGLAGQDFDQYIQHILGLFGAGQQGQQQLQQQGFQAGTGLGENLGNVLGTQGQYAFGGQAGQNSNRSNNWSNLISGATTLASGGLPSWLNNTNFMPSRSYG